MQNNELLLTDEDMEKFWRDCGIPFSPEKEEKDYSYSENLILLSTEKLRRLINKRINDTAI